jgi:hypothetical protein
MPWLTGDRRQVLGTRPALVSEEVSQPCGSANAGGRPSMATVNRPRRRHERRPPFTPHAQKDGKTRLRTQAGRLSAHCT